MTTIRFKKLHELAVIPTKAHADDAGYDLYACMVAPVCIPPGSVSYIPTGLAIAVPNGYFGAIFARSGLASKKGLRPANCVGVCDASFRGEYMVALRNDGSEDAFVLPGERIAQLVIMPYLNVNFEETEELDATDRGSDGFGSTGLE